MLCLKLDTCWKIKTINDCDLFNDAQWAAVVKAVCEKCKRKGVS